MAQKFIITSSGHFRYGEVNLHHQLLQGGEHCLGGGFYEFDYASARLRLSGKSYDYGRPMWQFVPRLIIPASLQDLSIDYEDVPLADLVPLKFE